MVIKGIVFDIKRNAVDDGPGIRTLIFLKGCAMRCRWCANPESQSFAPEVMYYKRKCVGCGKCVAVCPRNAVVNHKDYGLISGLACNACGECVSACVYGAREMIGKEMDVDEVMSIVRRDVGFYRHSGGGITLSGGEPFLQKDFVKEIFAASKYAHIHTAVETCGYAPWKAIEECLPYIDLVMYDCKLIDSDEHKAWTGVSNELILENLDRLCHLYSGEIIVRIPYIPGCNDSVDAQRKIYCHLSRYPQIRRVEVLPFHRFGVSKYEGRGKTYAFKDQLPVKKETLAHLVQLGADCGVCVRIDAL